MKENKPQWSVGDTVWYDPGTVGLLFRAVVKTEPWKFAGEIWVVGLEGLPAEFKSYSGRAAPSTLLGLVDAPCNVFQRRPEDDRSCIHWDQYRADQGTPSSRMNHVAEAFEEDTRSR